MVYNILVGGLTLHIQGVQVCVKVVFAYVLHMEIDIQHLYACLLEVVVYEGDGFHPVDELDFHIFYSVDLYHPLQEGQGNNHNAAAYHGEAIIPHTRCQT